MNNIIQSVESPQSTERTTSGNCDLDTVCPTDSRRPEAEMLLTKCLSSLRRWAHGRVPAAARGRFDTRDFVQEAAIRTLARLDVFEPRHPAALEAYMRRAIINLVRDEARRIARRPASTEVTEDLPCPEPRPLEAAIQHEADETYRRALRHLTTKDRRLILARICSERTASELARDFGFPSSDAARMAVARAFTKLKRQLESPPAPEASAPRVTTSREVSHHHKAAPDPGSAGR